MNHATVDCKIITLKNNSKLYWQFTCDRIWLTLENTRKQKIVIDEVGPDLYGYTYRLGFYLIKEFNNSLLFRGGCPANGPCIYTLINKETGRKIKEFGQLICIDADIKEEKGYQYDFVVCFNNNYDKLNIYYINSHKLLSVPFDASKNDLTATTPEYQFDKMQLQGNILLLNYTTTNNKKLTLKINLLNKRYSP